MDKRDSNSKPMIGTLFSLGNTQVAEIISMAGFDWVLIDMEHSVMSLEDVLQSIQALGDRILKIVRIPGNDDIWIKQVLDTGCKYLLCGIDVAVISDMYGRLASELNAMK